MADAVLARNRQGGKYNFSTSSSTWIRRMITVLITMVMMIDVFRGEKEKLRVRSVSGSAVGTWSLARRRRITRSANFFFSVFIDSFFYW